MQNIGIEISHGMKTAVAQFSTLQLIFMRKYRLLVFPGDFPEPSESQSKENLLPLHRFLVRAESPVFPRMAYLSMSLSDALSASLFSPAAFYNSICACLIVSA